MVICLSYIMKEHGERNSWDINKNLSPSFLAYSYGTRARYDFYPKTLIERVEFRQGLEKYLISNHLDAVTPEDIVDSMKLKGFILYFADAGAIADADLLPGVSHDRIVPGDNRSLVVKTVDELDLSCLDGGLAAKADRKKFIEGVRTAEDYETFMSLLPDLISLDSYSISRNSFRRYFRNFRNIVSKLNNQRNQYEIAVSIYRTCFEEIDAGKLSIEEDEARLEYLQLALGIVRYINPNGVGINFDLEEKRIDNLYNDLNERIENPDIYVLKELLSSAVKAEDYEAAAEIRDLIKESLDSTFKD